MIHPKVTFLVIYSGHSEVVCHFSKVLWKISPTISWFPEWSLKRHSHCHFSLKTTSRGRFYRGIEQLNDPLSRWQWQVPLVCRWNINTRVLRHFPPPKKLQRLFHEALDSRNLYMGLTLYSVLIASVSVSCSQTIYACPTFSPISPCYLFFDTTFAMNAVEFGLFWRVAPTLMVD